MSRPVSWSGVAQCSPNRKRAQRPKVKETGLLIPSGTNTNTTLDCHSVAGATGADWCSWRARNTKLHRLLVLSSALWTVIAAQGCTKSPQELPVVIATEADSTQLQWRDAHGPLRGEVPWVLRTDLLGPDTYLVIETPDGDRCAKSVSFVVLAAGVTEYQVTLVSDLHGKVSWTVVSGGGHKMKLFRCDPRPADDSRNECFNGGIPKPLFGELVGGFTAELAGGATERDGLAVRFERGFPCVSDAIESIGGESLVEPAVLPPDANLPRRPE